MDVLSGVSAIYDEIRWDQIDFDGMWQLSGIKTVKQVILVTSNFQISENRGLWSQQGFSKDIQDRMKKCECDLH